jgi:DMSO/TMAO reductase YedYZ molybdopterin-dependent catalytic subunit
MSEEFFDERGARRAQRRVLEQAMEREGRMPPGQSLTLKFPVLHVGEVPEVDLSTWSLRAWGELIEARQWNWEEFQALPRRKLRMDIHCVTRWSKVDTDWEGVSLQALVEEGLIQLKETARFLIQHCAYGFKVNIPLEIALSDNFLLATHFNGLPLEPEHGYPLRGVVGHIPGRDDLKSPYLWKGGKWLQGLEFVAEDRLGYWELVGYHNEADVWKEQRLAKVRNFL